MALRGLAYNVRMAAYNADGARVTGLASTITASLWADGVTTTLTGTVTEIGSTGVYIVPLTDVQMTAYNLCITATSSTAGITFDPVYLDTEAGRIDVATSTRLATSGYTTPPTVAEVQSGLARTTELPDITALAKTTEIPTVSAIQAGLATSSEVQTISGMIEAVDSVVDAIAARMPSSGTVATIGDLPIPPTTTAIADAVVPRVLVTSVGTVTDVAVGSLGTLILGRLSSRIDGNEQVIYQLDGTTEHTRLTVVPATEDIPAIAGMLPENE